MNVLLYLFGIGFTILAIGIAVDLIDNEGNGIRNIIDGFKNRK